MLNGHYTDRTGCKIEVSKVSTYQGFGGEMQTSGMIYSYDPRSGHGGEVCMSAARWVEYCDKFGVALAKKEG